MKKIHLLHNTKAQTSVGDKALTRPITVQVSDYISAIGVMVRRLPDGRTVVRDGDKEFAGREIATA